VTANYGPIRLCSHKRSGTHLLAATIWKNFELPDMSLRVKMPPPYKFIYGDKEWGPGTRAEIPWHRLWYTHNLLARDRRVLYIVRHPVDTLMSYWRLMDPLCRWDNGKYIGRQGVESWLRHAKWYTTGCCWVRYEDLISDKHDEILSRIADWFELTPKHDSYKRVKERVGWLPAKPPTQPKEPPESLLRAVKEIVPSGFLGYDV